MARACHHGPPRYPRRGCPSCLLQGFKDRRDRAAADSEIAYEDACQVEELRQRKLKGDPALADAKLHELEQEVKEHMRRHEHEVDTANGLFERIKDLTSEVDDILKTHGPEEFDKMADQFAYETEQAIRDRVADSQNYARPTWDSDDEKTAEIEQGPSAPALDRTAIPATLDYTLRMPYGLQLAMKQGCNPSKTLGSKDKPAMMSVGATYDLFGNPTSELSRKNKAAPKGDDVAQTAANLEALSVTTEPNGKAPELEEAIPVTEYNERKSRNKEYADLTTSGYDGYSTLKGLRGRGALIAQHFTANSRDLQANNAESKGAWVDTEDTTNVDAYVDKTLGPAIFAGMTKWIDQEQKSYSDAQELKKSVLDPWNEANKARSKEIGAAIQAYSSRRATDPHFDDVECSKGTSQLPSDYTHSPSRGPVYLAEDYL